jgi:signal recognition particle subunit SRP54
VIDSMTGQEAIHVAETFNTQLGITGIVLTKLDGDTRGGAALSVVEVTGRPIKLVGTGEKMDALEPFHPDRMATRILGMGDVVSLVERAQEAIDLDEAKELERKMRKQEFSLEDFLKIQRTMKRLGSLDQILGMLPIPGVTKDMREMLAHGGEQQLRRVEAIINSMTVEERRRPELINRSRKARIARGCGMEESEISKFLKDFEMMRKMMKQMTQVTDGMKKKKGKTPMAGMKLPKGGGYPPFSKGGGRPPFPFG